MRYYFLIVAVLGLLLLLHAAYPEAVTDGDAYMRMIYLSLLVLLIGSGFTLNRTSRSDNIRNAALWAAIIAGLALAYHILGEFK